MSAGHQVVVRFRAPPAAVSLANPLAPLPPAPPEMPAAPEPAAAKPPEPAPREPPAPAVTARPAAPDPREAEAPRRREEESAAVARVLEALTAAARRLDEEHRERLAAWRRGAVELAVTIAARLVHDRVAANSFAVEAVIREAAALLGPRQPLTVRLHPDDVTLLEDRLGGGPLFADGTEARVVADPSRGRGGCRVEADDAAVTARLGDQLAAVRQELLRGLGDAEPGT